MKRVRVDTNIKDLIRVGNKSSAHDFMFLNLVLIDCSTSEVLGLYAIDSSGSLTVPLLQKCRPGHS